ncbi:MAG: hypothetical protein ACI97A_002798 [Planctomycetota bacterium]|jgi:hypothetical protein
MKRSQGQHEDARGSLVFALLALGLVAAIYVLRVAPADQLLDKQRQIRATWELTHERTRKELEQLDAFSITIGTDHQVTERFLRKQNFARSGEYTIAPEGSGD